VPRAGSPATQNPLSSSRDGPRYCLEQCDVVAQRVPRQPGFCRAFRSYRSSLSRCF
jgi:hypothetical protein